MTALSVTQAQADRSEAARVEMVQIFENSAKVGATEVIPKICEPGQYETIDNKLGGDFVEGVALAIVRLLYAQPTPLPSFVKTALPPANDNTGCLIYVSNESGGAVPAFSDGSSWRRVTDRNVVS